MKKISKSLVIILTMIMLVLNFGGCAKKSDDKAMKVSILFSDNAGSPYNANWALIKEVEKLKNVKLDVQVVPASDYAAKKSIVMQRFIIRYGVFTILLLMLVGIYLIASRYHIRSKQPVTLVVQADGLCKAYTAPGANTLLTMGDTLVISQMPCGDWPFMLKSKLREPQSEVLMLQPVNPAQFLANTQGNTLLNGYVFDGEESMLRLIWQKVVSR